MQAYAKSASQGQAGDFRERRATGLWAGRRPPRPPKLRIATGNDV